MTGQSLNELQPVLHIFINLTAPAIRELYQEADTIDREQITFESGNTPDVIPTSAHRRPSRRA
jgi:hypothetical protein